MIRTVIVFFLVLSSINLSATRYYLDSEKGDDKYSGKHKSESWKSLGKINQQVFHPGDTISFKKGSEWQGELTINSSGTQDQPIIFTAYGTGPDPVIKNPDVENAVSIRINGDWNIIEHFLVREAHLAGIFISDRADHNQIRFNEATQTGIGISVHGRYNLITENYVHDLTIVRNTPGGDDDYGAVGIWLFSSNNEVSYNRMINCKAPSYDYGHDGGVVEFYGDVDSCYVHHNWGENCNGSFEVGGRGETVRDNTIAYNVYVNNGNCGGFHAGGKFGVKLVNMRIENNTFIDTGEQDYAIGFWRTDQAPEGVQYRNNIFYVPGYRRISNQSGFVHEHNLYYLKNGSAGPAEPGPDEITGNPFFKDLQDKDFCLQPGSPAIDAGMNLGYDLDFNGDPVPSGKAPEMGAFEYRPE